jgi:hypothetical protein
MITPPNNGRSHFYKAAVLLAILPLLLWLCVGVSEHIETEWQQRQFDKAFDHAGQVSPGWSAADIGPVFVAAEACQTPAARAFVEQKCVRALLDNRGEGVESIVAYHILWESQWSLSKPALEALQQLEPVIDLSEDIC